MAIRKHLSEFGINMQAERKVVCRLSELDYLASTNYFNGEHPCHIYFIGTRPKVIIDKNGFKFDRSSFTIRFKAQLQDEYEELELKFQRNNHENGLRFETKYPYFSFKIFENEKEIVYTNGPALLQSMGPNKIGDFYKYLDFKVWYIGQSYGVEGARTAPDRLKSHSTMQSIFEEINKNNPDKDVILGLFTFKQWVMMSFDGTMNLNEKENSEDEDHLGKLTNNIFVEGINEQQEINFTEAALIRYFKPEYNEKFKNTFPSPAHSSYSTCYDIDLNSVSIEFLTYDLKLRFYSNEVKSSWEHYATFNLHNYEDRKGMFDF
jgi:hypothetical protein